MLEPSSTLVGEAPRSRRDGAPSSTLQRASVFEVAPPSVRDLTPPPQHVAITITTPPPPVLPKLHINKRPSTIPPAPIRIGDDELDDEPAPMSMRGRQILEQSEDDESAPVAIRSSAFTAQADLKPPSTMRSSMPPEQAFPAAPPTPRAGQPIAQTRVRVSEAPPTPRSRESVPVLRTSRTSIIEIAVPTPRSVDPVALKASSAAASFDVKPSPSERAPRAEASEPTPRSLGEPLHPHPLEDKLSTSERRPSLTPHSGVEIAPRSTRAARHALPPPMPAPISPTPPTGLPKVGYAMVPVASSPTPPDGVPIPSPPVSTREAPASSGVPRSARTPLAGFAVSPELRAAAVASFDLKATANSDVHDVKNMSPTPAAGVPRVAVITPPPASSRLDALLAANVASADAPATSRRSALPKMNSDAPPTSRRSAIAINTEAPPTSRRSAIAVAVVDLSPESTGARPITVHPPASHVAIVPAPIPPLPELSASLFSAIGEDVPSSPHYASPPPSSGVTSEPAEDSESSSRISLLGAVDESEISEVLSRPRDSFPPRDSVPPGDRAPMSRRSWIPPKRLSLPPGSLSMSVPPASRASIPAQIQSPPERGRKILLVASIVAVSWCLVLIFAPTIPPARSMRTLGLLDLVLRSGWLRQATGYGLIGMTVAGLGISLRKRWKRFKVSDVPVWRAAHGVIAALSLVLFFLHTGLHAGSKWDLVLAVDFLAAIFLGAAAGIVVAWSERWSPLVARNRRLRASWVHLLLTWPLPILIALHVLAVYYF